MSIWKSLKGKPNMSRESPEGINRLAPREAERITQEFGRFLAEHYVMSLRIGKQNVLNLFSNTCPMEWNLRYLVVFRRLLYMFVNGGPSTFQTHAI